MILLKAVTCVSFRMRVDRGFGKLSHCNFYSPLVLYFLLPLLVGYSPIACYCIIDIGLKMHQNRGFNAKIS